MRLSPFCPQRCRTTAPLAQYPYHPPTHMGPAKPKRPEAWQRYTAWQPPEYINLGGNKANAIPTFSSIQTPSSMRHLPTSAAEIRNCTQKETFYRRQHQCKWPV